MLTENDIARLCRRVAEASGALAVGIFGSYAVGLARERSDLDLFVIEDTTLAPRARGKAVKRRLFGVLHPLDVHVFTPAEVEDTVHQELSFTWLIAKQARLYHWTEEAARRVPSLLKNATMATAKVGKA